MTIGGEDWGDGCLLPQSILIIHTN